MSEADRSQKVLGFAAEEISSGGLHEASTQTIACRAKIAQEGISLMFETKKVSYSPAIYWEL